MNWYEEVKKEQLGIEELRVKAFLGLIGFSEGTDRVVGSDTGYNVVVGGTLFHDYSDHPRQLIDLPRLGIKSTAAGRYQILSRYWDHYKPVIGAKDFSPENQDKYAIHMFKEVKALVHIQDGNIESAIINCASRWASFPNAGYGQHQYSMEEMLEKYDEILKEISG